MSAEKLQEYIDSIDELQGAYSKVKEYSAIIGEVSRYLQLYPYKMTVSNVSFVVTAEREYSLNQDKWPSAKQLGETLSDYVRQREKVKMLYASLSQPQRESVKPPPEI